MSALTNFPLEGDGIIENLFYYLWCKDELDNGPKVNIPDTIIYKYRQPAFWYFTAKDGSFKRKNKGNLVNVRIEESFSRKATGSDIIAYYISTCEGEDGNPSTTIEYFNRETFHDFLYNREKVNNGIIQKFVEPKGVSNTMVRSIWSPKVCLLERRVNIRNLQDRRFGMYERAVTYEGAEFYSNPAPVRGAILPTHIQRLCESMIQHVAEVSFQKYKVSRLVSNFKIDAQDRIWFLWSSSLRLEGETMLVKGTDIVPKGPVNIDTVVRLPPHVRLGGKHFKNKSYRCCGCGMHKPAEQQYQIPYKTVIMHFEQLLALLQQDLKIKQELTGNTGLGIEWPPAPEVIEAWGGGCSVGFPKSESDSLDLDYVSGPPTAEEVEIPPVLRALHPKLMVNDYRRYRNDPLFMYKSVTVCEDCYLVYAEVMNSSSLESMPVAAGVMGGGSVGNRNTVRNQRLAPLGASGSQGGSSRNRLPASAWKVEQYGGSKRGGKTGAGSVRKNAPNFPDRITAESLLASAVETRWDNDNSNNQTYDEEEAMEWGSGGGGVDFSVENGGAGDQAGAGSLPQPPALSSLEEREEQFFKDLYHNPNLQKGHPLSHMISGAAKMRAANGELIQSASSPANMSATEGAGINPLPPVRSGTKRVKGGDKYVGAVSASSPYYIPQKLGGSKSKKKLGASRSKKGLLGSRSQAGSTGYNTSQQSPSKSAQKKSQKKGASTLGPTESSLQHREFLLQTLQDVKEQLANPPPLLDPPPAEDQFPGQAAQIGNAAVGGYEESKEEGEQQEYKEEEREGEGAGGMPQWSVDRQIDGELYSIIVRGHTNGCVMLVFQPQNIKKWMVRVTNEQLSSLGADTSDSSGSWVSGLIGRIAHADAEKTQLHLDLGASVAPLEPMTQRLKFQRGRTVNDMHVLVSLSSFAQPKDMGEEVIDVVVYNVQSGQRVYTVLAGADCADDKAFDTWCEATLDRLTASTAGGALSIAFV